VSKRTKIIAAVVVLVVAVGVVAFLVAGQQGSGPEIETATATKQELAVTVTASGKVEPSVNADVFPPGAGTIDTIDVLEGEKVTAGQKIAQMDTDAFELQVSQARAALAQAKAGSANAGATGGSNQDVTASKRSVSAANSGIAAAKASVSAANAAWRNAQKAHDQASAALPSSSPTVTALAVAEKQAFAGLKQAQAGLSQARAGLSSAKSGLNKAKVANNNSSDSAADAAVAQASKALALAEKALDDATLVAPIDGVILFNSAAAALGGGGEPTEGSAVSPQAAPFTVVDFSGLKFTAEVDEADVNRVKVGMRSTITLDAFPGDEFVTTVTRLNPAAQSTATGGTIFAVELELTDTGKDILIGMKGDSTIEVSSRADAITIPVEALFSEGGTDYVYTVENSVLKRTEITVGATTDTEVEVIDGLPDGAVVALSGSTQYTDGMAVRIKK